MTTQPISFADTQPNEAFDEIRFAFLDAWDAAEAAPEQHASLLKQFVREHPDHADRLIDFVLEFAALERDEFVYETELSPEAVRAGARVRESLGLGEYNTTPAPTFSELLTESGLKLGKLSKTLGVPVLFLDQIERGLLTTWTTATVRKLADALSRTTDEIATALEASLNTTDTQRLAGAHFSARGGTPDEEAVAGTPQTLDAMLDDLGFTPEQKREWLAEE